MRYVYRAQWLKTPVNNEIDAIEIRLGNCTMLTDTNKFQGTADVCTSSGKNYGKSEKFKKKRDVVQNACAGGTSIRVITFDLPGEREGRKGTTFYHYENTSIVVTGYALISNLSIVPKIFTADAKYMHCETSKTYKLNPSINSSGGVSYGISSSESQKYNYLTDGINLLLDVDMTK